MTKNLKRVALAGAAACMLCLGASKTATADPWNMKTIITLDQSMRVPGATLKPDTYVFELADPETSRDVVNIRRMSDNKLVASALVRPIVRNTDDHGLALEVAMPGTTDIPMLKGWLYPGLGGGREFMYQKADSRLIAHAEVVEIPVAPRS